MFDGKNFALIKANRLFAGTAQKIKISISGKELLSIGAGSVIFKENDDADAVYLVISGQIKLEIPGIFKKPVIVTKTVNDFFGEKEYLERINRKGNAVAATDCQLCILKKDKIDKLISLDKRVFVNLYGINEDSSEFNEVFQQMPAPGSNGSGHETAEETEEDSWFKTAEESKNLAESELNKIIDSETPDITDDEIKKWTEELESEIQLQEESKKVNIITDDEIKIDLSPVPPDIKPEKEDNDINVEFDFLKELELLENMTIEDTSSSEVINFDLLKDELLPETIEQIKQDELIPDIIEENKIDEPISDTFIPDNSVEPVLEEPAKDEMRIPEPEVKEEVPPVELPVIQNNDKEDIPVIPIAAETKTPPVYVDDLDELFVKRNDETIEEILNSAETFNIDEISTIPEEPLKFIPDEPIAADIPETLPAEQKTKETPLAEPPVIKPEKPDITLPPAEPAAKKDSDAINELSEEVDEMTAAKFKQLMEAAQKINSSIKLDETLESVLAAAKTLTGAERGYLYLVDRESNELWAKALNNEVQRETRLKIGEDIAGICAEKGITINLKDAQKDPRFNKVRDKADGTKTKSLLCVPILNKTGFVSAVLHLINSSNGEFTQSDEEALGALSVNISLALENAELMERQLQTDRVSSMGKMANFLIQDIKKPVLTIKYYAEHIKKKEVAPDVVQILNMLIDQSNAVVDLVQTTLSYSEGKGILRAQPLRLSTVLNDIFNLLAEYVESRHVNLYKKYEADAVVNIDKREFYQACFQIVKNACDAMPKGGDIYVLVRIENSIIKIEFKDAGVGIPESIKSKVFEPFMSHGKKQGVGLGLSIAEKIVKDHSGEITFESEIGEGTTFRISMPYISLV